MRLPRFRIQTLMIAVAVVAGLLGSLQSSVSSAVSLLTVLGLFHLHSIRPNRSS